MGAETKIEWCDHTFNPWIGCTKVSPGCTNCYAETLMDKRWGKVNWGKDNPRQRTSESNWKQVERWERKAEWEENDAHACERAEPRRPRVFVASLADWLDPEVPIEWLADLLDLIRRCPHLDFLLLTKRPELWRERVNDAADESIFRELQRFPDDRDFRWWLRGWLENSTAPANIWIGTSVEDQQRADERIPELLRIPAKVLFLSCEPLLGEVNLPWYEYEVPARHAPLVRIPVDWVIVGGESGPKARPMHPDWARSLRDQCQAAGVPFFFKQWGERIYPGTNAVLAGYKPDAKKGGRLLDGREWSEFPNEKEVATA